MYRVERTYRNQPAASAAAPPVPLPPTATETAAPETALEAVAERVTEEVKVPFVPSPIDQVAAVKDAVPGQVKTVGPWAVTEDADGIHIRRVTSAEAAVSTKYKRGVTLTLGKGDDEIAIMIARTGGADEPVTNADENAHVPVRSEDDPGSAVSADGGGAPPEVVGGSGQ